MHSTWLLYTAVVEHVQNFFGFLGTSVVPTLSATAFAQNVSLAKARLPCSSLGHSSAAVNWWHIGWRCCVIFLFGRCAAVQRLLHSMWTGQIVYKHLLLHDVECSHISYSACSFWQCVHVTRTECCYWRWCKMADNYLSLYMMAVHYQLLFYLLHTHDAPRCVSVSVLK